MVPVRDLYTYIYIMVLILDGNSEMNAYVESEMRNLRNYFSRNLIISQEGPVSLHTCAMCTGLPYSIVPWTNLLFISVETETSRSNADLHCTRFIGIKRM